MKITDIKQQVKRQNRFSVYADDKYAFSVSDLQLGKLGLRVGQEISKEELSQLKQDSDFGKLYDKALMWLSLRPRSQWEIDQYLQRKTDDSEQIDLAKQKIADIGQINDLAFAQSWVASRRSLKNVSRQRLTQELRQKRVPNEVIDQVLQEDETTDLETVIKLINKKSQQSRYKDPDKLMAFLARQGFRYDDIKEALKQQAEM